MTAYYPASARIPLLLAAACAVVALGAPAYASNPTYQTLIVPGDGGPTSTTWQGAALSGPGLGQAQVPCSTPTCDEEQLIPISQDQHYTDHHVLTLTTWVTYSGSSGVFDLFLLDANHQQIPGAQLMHAASGQQFAVGHIQLDNYYLQVVSDGASGTSYVGHAELSATNPPTRTTVPPPATTPPPPTSSTGGSAVSGPSTGSGANTTVQPGISGAPTGSPNPTRSATPFGAQQAIPPAHPASSSGGLGKWWIAIGLGIAAVGYVGNKVLRRP